MRSSRCAGVVSAVALLAGCGGGGGSSSGGGSSFVTPTPTPSASATTSTCSLSARQAWAYGQLDEWYLFPDLFQTGLSSSAYGDLQSYIDALVAPARAQNKDRYFTYVTSIAEENAYYASGANAGFGFRLGYDSSNRRLFVIETYEGTPAMGANIDRGSEILSINGQTVSSLFASGGSYAVYEALGSSTAGVSRTLQVRDQSGVTRDVTLTKTEYELDPVSNRYGTKIITDGAKKVGYINLRTFITPAESDLKAAFAQFKAAGVSELIVDVRYNGGGLISTAEVFADLMAAGRAGQPFGYITFRPSKSSNNETMTFQSQNEAISPTRVAFIGTGSTASASELLINGFVPFLGTNMALVGANTYGKPVGQIALDRTACDDRLRAIALKIENSSHQGEYFNGLATTVPVSCRASDDITHALGDPNEAMIKQALDFLGNRGTCTAASGIGTAALSGRTLFIPNNASKTVQYEAPGTM